VRDIGLLLTWICSWILAVSVAARELPQEEIRRTVYALLAKPITRGELVLGKWLGSWGIVALATLCFYALISLVVAGMGYPIAILPLIQGYILHVASLGILCAMALLFSTRMNHDAAGTLTYVLSLAALVVVPKVPELMAKEEGLTANALLVLYNALPHFEVFDMRRRLVHGYGALPLSTFALILCYGIALTALLLTVAWVAYRRKRFTRGKLAS
jgi:ABC-type transport system involved in multi-copper enzyme maturation permease subunit